MDSSSLDFKELVRSKTDLVQLIGESTAVHSQRGGRMFTCLCPFHDDHNPSMQINPERQSYRCWVCNEGGDCFSFMMKHENVGFRDALELLARRAGLELPVVAGQRGDTGPSKATLHEVIAWAEEQLHQCLLRDVSAQRARDYLQERGFTEETIRKFRLGYWPETRGWMQSKAQGRFDTEQLEAVSLVTPWRDGRGFSDFCSDRVIFPIRDERGRPVALGGRVLPGTPPRRAADGKVIEEPKYKNSRDTPIFSKSRLVFGLDTARDGIRQHDLVAVTEGYTDCIKAQQAGLSFVVGTLGTALTEMHVRLLRRFTRRVVLLFDGDEAGRRAAGRALEKFLAQDVDLRVLTLPNELDPDEFLTEYGAEALRELVEQAPEAWDYQLQQLAREHGLDTVDGRMQVATGLLSLMAVASDLTGTVREGLLLQSIAHRVGVKEEDLRRRLKELRSGSQAARAISARKVSADGSTDDQVRVARRRQIESLQRHASKDDLLECELLAILFTAPDKIEQVRCTLGSDDIQHEALRELFNLCCDLAEQGRLPSYSTVLAELECPELKRLAVWIDDQAHARGLPARLNSESASTLEAAVGEVTGRVDPTSTYVDVSLLQTVLDAFRWRRETRRQMLEVRQIRTGTGPRMSTSLNASHLKNERQGVDQPATIRTPVSGQPQKSATTTAGASQSPKLDSASSSLRPVPNPVMQRTAAFSAQAVASDRAAPVADDPMTWDDEPSGEHAGPSDELIDQLAAHATAEQDQGGSGDHGDHLGSQEWPVAASEQFGSELRVHESHVSAETVGRVDQQTAPTPGAGQGSPLPEELRARLARANEYHAQRAGRKRASSG